MGLDEEFADAIRAIVRDEMTGISVCTFGSVRRVEDDHRRVEVALNNDPEYVQGDVPLLTQGPGDGSGDIAGVTPGDDILVLFSADDVTAMAAKRGATPDADRERTPQHMVALPLGPYVDTDAVPDHESGERIIAHQNGTLIRMGGHDGADIQMAHPAGMGVEMDAATDETTDARSVPREHAGEVRLRHPSGVGVSVHDHGIAITPGDVGGGDTSVYGMAAYGDGAYGESGGQQGVLSHRQHNDPWRVEMVGDPHRGVDGHRHLVPDGEGNVAMSGPPIPVRELFEWFCANFESLSNSDDLHRARSFYTAWLDWLEAEMDATLTPEIGAGDVTDWPYPEPAPSRADRETFASDGYGEAGFGEGTFGY